MASYVHRTFIGKWLEFDEVSLAVVDDGVSAVVLLVVLGVTGGEIGKGAPLFAFLRHQQMIREQNQMQRLPAHFTTHGLSTIFLVSGD